MQKLLKIPYFLNLFEQIALHGRPDNVNLSGIETEAQLLSFYWTRNVENNIKTLFFASKLTKLLLAEYSLSADLHAIITDQNTEAYEELLRQNIIVNSGIQGRRISFAHNILLEYAISRYVLSEDIQEQTALVNANVKLPFLFMQSFLYFYSDLWIENVTSFYTHYFTFKSFDSPVFRLFHQTILNYTLITSYNDPEQLEPLLKETDALKRAEIIRKALESLRFIHKNILRPQDVKFLNLLSKQLQPILIWEVGHCIDSALKQEEFLQDAKSISLLTAASQNYLSYVLEERKTNLNKQFIDSNSGYWGVKNLATTFGYGSDKSKEIIEGILKLLEEEDFPLNYFHTLSSCIDDIFKVDPGFGNHVYKTIYLYSETSQKETNFGGGAVLNLRSNRRQDYGCNYYALEQKYPNLLKIDFVKAMQLGAEIVNYTSTIKSYSGDNLIHDISFGGYKGKFARDKSYYENDEQHGAFSHGKAIFDFLDLQEDETIRPLYTLVAKTVEASSLWRKLFSLLQKKVADSSGFIYELISNKIFFECDETFHEATNLLHSVWPYLSHGQHRHLEEQFHRLEHPEPIYANQKWNVLRLKKIYSGLPIKTLQLRESQIFISQNGTSANEKLVQSGLTMAKVHTLTEEERRFDAGFGPADSEGNDEFELYDIIDSFNVLFYNNQRPSVDRQLYNKPYKAAIKLFATAQAGIFRNERMKQMCDYTISNFACTLSQQISILNKKEVIFLKKIALHYVKSDSYKEVSYDQGTISDKSFGVYSPNARTAAISTLVNLLFANHDRDSEIIVLECMSDNSKIIRLKTLNALSYYWDHDRKSFWGIINQRSAIEGHSSCINIIISSLCYDDIIMEDISTIGKVSEVILERLQHHDTGASREIWQAFTHLQLIRLFRHDKEEALETIRKGLNIKEFCRNLCFEMRSSLNSINGKPDFLILLEKSSAVFTVFMDIISYRFRSLKLSGLHAESSQNDFEIIDHVIQNIFFAVDYENGNVNGHALSPEEKKGLFEKFIPILESVVCESALLESGFMAAHTGYYFMKVLNTMVSTAPEVALNLSTTVVEYSAKNGFTYDRATLPEIVMLIEKLIVDHKSILDSPENFGKLIMILDQFEQSGSVEALELAWSLKKLF